MDICPHCGAPTASSTPSSGRCEVCGMSLLSDAPPAEAETEASAGETQNTVAGQADVDTSTLLPEHIASNEALAEQPVSGDATIALPPGDLGGGAADDTLLGEDLIKPRDLSPGFARRVTAVWEATQSQFHDPQETIKSEKGGHTDVGDLFIGKRTVSEVGDPGDKDYELTEVLGEGAMGVIWTARQRSLDRDVAIKKPKGAAAKTEAGRRQFMSEVVVTGQLDHPNIVPIYELGRDASGELFYSMKRVEGRPWNELLDERAFDQHENLEILLKVCDAIRFAHDRGVIHRDIKPHNVMVGQYGEVSVMDWGIALQLDLAAPAGGVARISPAGTPAYMAPEMATGAAGDIGPWTDVYLLGAVLYEVLTGEPPHPPPTDSKIQLQVLNDALLIAARNEISPITHGGELNKIAYRAMATEVQNRYQSVKQLQEAIREYLSHVESINLTERGTTLLDRARVNGHSASSKEDQRFDDFDRARFAFEEALAIWPENRTARTREAETVLAYARYAYEEGAYARGIALLREDNPAHKDLLRKLIRARKRTDRLSMLLKAAVLLIIVGTSVFSFFLYRAWDSAERERVAAVVARDAAVAAEQAEKKAKEKEERARIAAENAEQAALQAKEAEEEAKKDALVQRDKARQAEQVAITAKEEEEVQRKAADEARIVAVREKKNAERSSYAFEIGLAAEELQRNSFDHAESILGSQAEHPEKSELRNWEWGHLNALVSGDAKNYSDGGNLLQSRVEATAISQNRQWVAAGTSGGQVYVWPFEQGQDVKPVTIRYGEAVHAVAITNDGKTLLVAGRTSGSRHPIKAWSLPVEEGAAPDREFGYDRSPNLSLDVSGDSQTVLTSATDGWVALTPLGSDGPPVGFVASSQQNRIFSARFSTDDRWIVTAGEDGVVRVWSAAAAHEGAGTVAESMRIESHDGPVYAATFTPNGDYVISGGRDRQILATPFDPEAASRTSYSPIETIRNRLTKVAADLQRSQSIVVGEHDAAVRCIALGSDDAFLFTGGQDHTVRVWDLSEGMEKASLEKTLRGHGGWVASCLVVPGDADRVLSGGYDRRVQLWNWKDYAFPQVLRAAGQRSLGDRQLTAGAATRDGAWVATASQDGVITVWNMSDPRNPQAQELAEGHDWQATTAQYFPDGRRLLTAGGDNTALVWDVQQGNELVRMGGWNKSVGAGWRGVATVAADGRRIATGAAEEVLARVWNAETGELIASIPTPNYDAWPESERPEATALAYAPGDSNLLVVGDQWGTCYLIRGDDPEQMTSLKAHPRKISAIAFLPDGSGLLTASFDGSVVEWDLSTPAPTARAMFQHDDRVVAMDLADDGLTLVTAAGPEDAAAVLRVWNRTTPEAPLHTAPLTALRDNGAVSRDPLAERGNGDQVNSRGGLDKNDPLIRAVAVHPEDARALITIFDPTTSTYRIKSWSWMDGQRGLEPASTGSLRDVSTAIYAKHRPGAMLTVGGRGARVQTLAGRASRVTMTYRPQSSIHSVTFSPDGQTLLSASADSSIKIWTLDPQQGVWEPTGKVVGEHVGDILSVSFHPRRSDRFLTAGEDGTAKLWQRDGEQWTLLRTITPPGKGGDVHAAIFVGEADEAPILTAGASGAWIWDRPDAEPRAINGDEEICCAAATSDGNWIVIGSGSEARIFNVATLQPAATPLTGHSAEITSLAFTSDSTRLFTASRDSTVKLWNSQTIIDNPDAEQVRRELLTLEGHSQEVTSISVASGGAQPVVMTTGLDGQALLWPYHAQ